MFACMGGERPRVLAVSSTDPVMSVVGPIGLAAATGTALLIDMANQMGGAQRTLSDLMADGPRLDELSPGRKGVAVLRAGYLTTETLAFIDQLATRWPAVVVRPGPEGWSGPTVPLRPLYPGWLAQATTEAAVWQQLPSSPRPPGPGPVLPVLRPGVVRRVLSGGMPDQGKWLKVWERVWELPWA